MEQVSSPTEVGSVDKQLDFEYDVQSESVFLHDTENNAIRVTTSVPVAGCRIFVAVKSS